MSTIRSIINKLQSYNPDDKIEDLLQNTKFVADITEVVNQLPDSSRTIFSQNVHQMGLSKRPIQKEKRNESTRALKAIEKIEAIDLPSEVLEKYTQCQRIPSTFWSFDGIKLDLNAAITEPIEIFVCQAYLGIVQLESERVWAVIRWRFFVIFFYDLVFSLGRKHFTSSFSDELVRMLVSSPSIRDTANKIKNNLKRWVSAGCHYATLSDSLGAGAPFLLPQAVTDKTWEDALPLAGDIYAKAIKHLKSKDFCEKLEKIDANTLGAAIREAILKPFRWNLSAFKQNIDPNTSNSYQDPTGTASSTSPRESELPTTNDIHFISPPDRTISRPKEDFHNYGESSTEADSRASRRSCNSINALLNSAETTQGQQLSQVGSTSLHIASEALLDDCGRDIVVNEQLEIESRGQKRNLEQQAETYDWPNQRRRIDSSSVLDSSPSQQSIGSTHHQQEAIGEPTSNNTNVSTISFIAKLAEISRLEGPLGAYLFKYIKKGKECGRFTGAVNLHFGIHEGEDFKLEIWLCSSVKHVILQAKRGPFEGLQNILGDYLFEGMKASNLRKEEKEKGKIDCTDAVNIFTDGESNWKMEVILSFKAGLDMHKKCYGLG
ncbi:hypothetical protein ACMFMG_011709 [Clarireedia jacksonii]